MANDSYTQQRLAADLTFQGRVRNALANVAWQVLGEPDTTPNHAWRATYANQVINNLTFQSAGVANWLVQRPNLMAFATSYDFKGGNVVTASGDADIESQLMSDWDKMAGPPPTTPNP